MQRISAIASGAESLGLYGHDSARAANTSATRRIRGPIGTRSPSRCAGTSSRRALVMRGRSPRSLQRLYRTELLRRDRRMKLDALALLERELVGPLSSTSPLTPIFRTSCASDASLRSASLTGGDRAPSRSAPRSAPRARKCAPVRSSRCRSAPDRKRPPPGAEGDRGRRTRCGPHGADACRLRRTHAPPSSPKKAGRSR